MLNVRKSEDRGANNMGWLDAKHSFSFGGYYDPRHMGFRGLRVINEDRIAEGMGFGEHPHRDMEIITYVIDGTVEHKDSMGNHGVIRRGEVQRMSAGSGVRHSEYNPDSENKTHMLQIWIEPAQQGAEPGYEEFKFNEDDRLNNFVTIASPERRDGGMWIGADAVIRSAVLEPGQFLGYELEEGRSAWVQVVSGDLVVNGERLKAGDGVAIASIDKLDLVGGAANAEIVLFDLA